MRCIVATVLSMSFLRHTSGKESYQIQEKHSTKFLLTRSVISGFNAMVVFVMILMIEVHMATILGCLAPILALIMGVFMLGEKFTLAKIGVFLLSILGAVIVIEPAYLLPWLPSHLENSKNSPLGIALGIFAALITAYTSIILKQGVLTSWSV